MSSNSGSAALAGLAQSFQQWAEPWARLGMAVSLWDAQCACMDCAESAAQFWQMLSQHSPRFQRSLKRVCQEALTGEGAAYGDGSGVFLCGLPIMHRQRPLGAILVSALR